MPLSERQTDRDHRRSRSNDSQWEPTDPPRNVTGRGFLPSRDKCPRDVVSLATHDLAHGRSAHQVARPPDGTVRVLSRHGFRVTHKIMSMITPSSAAMTRMSSIGLTGADSIHYSGGIIILGQRGSTARIRAQFDAIKAGRASECTGAGMAAKVARVPGCRAPCRRICVYPVFLVSFSTNEFGTLANWDRRIGGVFTLCQVLPRGCCLMLWRLPVAFAS